MTFREASPLSGPTESDSLQLPEVVNGIPQVPLFTADATPTVYREDTIPTVRLVRPQPPASSTDVEAAPPNDSHAGGAVQSSVTQPRVAHVTAPRPLRNDRSGSSPVATQTLATDLPSTTPRQAQPQAVPASRSGSPKTAPRQTRPPLAPLMEEVPYTGHQNEDGGTSPNGFMHAAAGLLEAVGIARVAEGDGSGTEGQGPHQLAVSSEPALPGIQSPASQPNNTNTHGPSSPQPQNIPAPAQIPPMPFAAARNGHVAGQGTASQPHHSFVDRALHEAGHAAGAVLREAAPLVIAEVLEHALARPAQPSEPLEVEQAIDGGGLHDARVNTPHSGTGENAIHTEDVDQTGAWAPQLNSPAYPSSQPRVQVGVDPRFVNRGPKPLPDPVLLPVAEHKHWFHGIRFPWQPRELTTERVQRVEEEFIRTVAQQRSTHHGALVDRWYRRLVGSILSPVEYDKALRNAHNHDVAYQNMNALLQQEVRGLIDSNYFFGRGNIANINEASARSLTVQLADQIADRVRAIGDRVLSVREWQAANPAIDITTRAGYQMFVEGSATAPRQPWAGITRHLLPDRWETASDKVKVFAIPAVVGTAVGVAAGTATLVLALPLAATAGVVGVGLGLSVMAGRWFSSKVANVANRLQLRNEDNLTAEALFISQSFQNNAPFAAGEIGLLPSDDDSADNGQVEANFYTALANSVGAVVAWEAGRGRLQQTIAQKRLTLEQSRLTRAGKRELRREIRQHSRELKQYGSRPPQQDYLASVNALTQELSAQNYIRARNIGAFALAGSVAGFGAGLEGLWLVKGLPASVQYAVKTALHFLSPAP